MKVLLIQPMIFLDKWAGAVPVLPLGAMFISNALQKNNIEYRFHDFCFENFSSIEQKCKMTLLDFQPDFIGYSVRNIDTTLFLKPVFFLDTVKKVIKLIKKYLPEKSIHIIGGAAFSIMPKEILSFLELDYGIVGEGEQAFIDLLNKLYNKEDISQISGLVYKKNDEIIVNKDRNFISDLDSFSNYNFENIDKRYFDIKDSNMGLQRCSVNIQTKRGCHFKCSYCIYPSIEGKNIRFFSIPRIVDNLIKIYENYGIDTFEIVDSVFNEPVDNSIRFCNALIQRNCKMKWTADFRPVGFTDDFVSLIKQAGCQSVEIGVDAVESSLIKVLNKHFSSKDIDNTLSILNKHKMNYLLYIIIGAPTDDDAKIIYTLEYLERNNVENILFFFGIRIYPDTEIYEYAINENIITDESDLLHPAFYFSNKITEQCLDIIRKYQTKHKGWIFIAVDKLVEHFNKVKHG